jgi:hypothetical protein
VQPGNVIAALRQYPLLEGGWCYGILSPIKM